MSTNLKCYLSFNETQNVTDRGFQTYYKTSLMTKTGNVQKRKMNLDGGYLCKLKAHISSLGVFTIYRMIGQEKCAKSDELWKNLLTCL